MQTPENFYLGARELFQVRGVRAFAEETRVYGLQR
jgi:hypothetical protein